MRWRATPPCNRSCALASAGFFAAHLFLGCARARGNRTTAAPAKAHLGPRASHSRAAWHPDPHAFACGCTVTCDYAARGRYRIAACPRRNAYWDGWRLPAVLPAACAAAGRSQPGLGGDGGKLTPRAHAYADMWMPGRECTALELNPPRTFLLARRQCGGLARAQPRKRRAACEKPAAA